jgi:hypothetical protein
MDCNFNYNLLYVNQVIFKSDKHVIQTINQHKLCLSPYDSKRLVCKDMIETLPIGY